MATRQRNKYGSKSTAHTQKIEFEVFPPFLPKSPVRTFFHQAHPSIKVEESWITLFLIDRSTMAIQTRSMA